MLVMKSGQFFILSVTINGLIKVRVLSLQYLEQYQNYYDWNYGKSCAGNESMYRDFV